MTRTVGCAPSQAKRGRRAGVYCKFATSCQRPAGTDLAVTDCQIRSKRSLSGPDDSQIKDIPTTGDYITGIYADVSGDYGPLAETFLRVHPLSFATIVLMGKWRIDNSILIWPARTSAGTSVLRSNSV